MLTSIYYAGKRYLKYFVQFSTNQCAKNGALEHYRPERNTAYHQVFKHNRHKFSLKCQYILRMNIHINWCESTNGIVRNTAPEHDFSPLLLPVFRDLPLQGKFSRSLLQFICSEVAKCKIDLSFNKSTM